MDQAIGIDIGGTFVDVVIADGSGLRIAKEPSTPGDPARGVLRALDRLTAAGVMEPARVKGVAHGCTVATNALLERKWGRTALVTTQGFRDVLEIGRQNRPSLYDLTAQRPACIVPRDLRFEVAGRVGADGAEVVPLDIRALRNVASRIRDAGVEAVAVSFLFSFLRPGHEQAARDVLAPLLGVPIVLSSEVLPEIREFERTMTTALSAALRPVIGAYMGELEIGGASRGLAKRWRVMQSSGAVTSAARAQDRPASLLLSGPAGGVQGARAIGARLGEPNLITMDMGGTSCDVALVTGGEIEQTQGGRVGGYPVALPMVAVHTIGAGGGSVAWIDAGGALRVGPESMGAMPGPACYARGGRATVTDAHLVLGHLAGDRPLGGLERLDLDAARAAIDDYIAAPLGLTIEEAALGILEVADAAMERALRVVTVERGRDPRDYALLAFGGAGPLHGVAIARRLGIRKVIVPRAAGVLSAYGLLVAEAGHDLSRGLMWRLDRAREADLRTELRRLHDAGAEALAVEGTDSSEMRFRAAVDLRYAGQSHELTVDLGQGEVDVGALREAFDATHAARYGHASPGEAVEIVTLRLCARGPALLRDARARVAGGAVAPLEGGHEVWLDAAGPRPARRVNRDWVAREGIFEGPLVIAGEDATILVPDGVRGRCDELGDLVLEVELHAKN